ncbi:30S ribosomal protein S17 [Candidatus Nitronereus thalassa]|uniref:Small ribosomal subunit protein uS17 n=1 Tax=Candidatus Nitronereus thalassa TaxID=3020898 RepID=A0ABU3KBS6_9BACT|nr:30S ribosomal protein S17 [Candidatus Nitronereus thalassa]MDT7043848.1 30S ribosomal protein S17 [Candidatus Nitronereus thalassa]
MGNPERRRQRVSYGEVIKDKMEKTVVVAVTRFVPHPLYGKVVRRVSRLKAHDEKNESKIGDRVKIVETRPLSKDKHWRVSAVVEKGERSQQA